MEAIAVIPATSDAVAVPSLHLQPVAGLPLVARAVRTAKASRLCGRVLVATDDPRIAEAALGEGVEVVRCPGDQQGTTAVLICVLESLPVPPEVLVLLDGTAPLTWTSDLDGTLEVFLGRQADSAFAAVELHGPLWIETPDGETVAVVQAGPSAGRRFLEAGSVYAMRTEGLLRHRRRLFGKTAVYPIDRERFLRIETPGDLYRARQLLGETTVSLKKHPVIYVDVDETICTTPCDRDYRRSVPVPENIAAINRLFDRGHRIVYWTARGGRSGVDYAELTRTQLDAWGARRHAVLAGKPSYDLLICDKAVGQVPFVP